MKLRKQISIFKSIIVACIFLALVCSLIIVILTIKGSSNKPTNEFHLSINVTPTPYQLPTIIYDQPSYLVTILGQVFRNKNSLTNPYKILENSQKQIIDEHFEVYVQDNYLPVDTQWWLDESNLVYEYVMERLDVTMSQKVDIIFIPAEKGNCASRGITFHEETPIIVIFANQDTSKDQILAVLAHELGHVFIHKKYENLSDLALSEGMATWAAGDYWTTWKGVDNNSAVRSYINDKTYLPLFQNYDMEKANQNVPECIIYRDKLLTEFASFIDYLIQSRKLAQLSALFNIQKPELINNQRIVYPPDFKAIYGIELNQLEQDWLRDLLLNQ